jgi:hypothetical protein
MVPQQEAESLPLAHGDALASRVVVPSIATPSTVHSTLWTAAAGRGRRWGQTRTHVGKLLQKTIGILLFAAA